MQTIDEICVIGAGTMGHGIAQVAAAAKIQVTLCDQSDDAVARGLSSIEKSLAKFVKKERMTAEDADAARKRITGAVGFEDAAKSADMIVEAVPEVMELKLSIFETLGRVSKAGAVLGTNTSSLSVTEIAAASGKPAQCVGLHFFNPVPILKLLEVVRGLSTSDDTIACAMTFAERIGKEAVLVRDWPGFATSRLGIILGCEAIRMVEQGVAEPAAIDRAMELGYRHPMGPLRLTDLVGLDVRLHIMEHLHAELGEQFRPPALLRQMVRAGKLGRKSGEGFYKYK